MTDFIEGCGAGLALAFVLRAFMLVIDYLQRRADVDLLLIEDRAFRQAQEERLARAERMSRAAPTEPCRAPSDGTTRDACDWDDGVAR